MSCQSLSRGYDEKVQCGSFHRSSRFGSEARASRRAKDKDGGSTSISALSNPASIMSQSAPSHVPFDMDDINAPPPAAASCRFPKLEECAHFHYERVNLGGIRIEVVEDEENFDDPETLEEGWLTLSISTHVSAVTASCDGDVTRWSLRRNADNLTQLDDILHRCIYDRKVSGLPNLSEEITSSLLKRRTSYKRTIELYMHHFSMIADDSVNCAVVLSWLQCDNKGYKLLVANEDSSSINTPAVAAGYSVRKYVSQARDEISFEVGDMISIIDMPGPQESVWWRGKRGFRVGFFPRHCVAVIGDKVPRHMTHPPPLVHSVAVAPIKPVLRKHGKLISLFRSFILSRPSRRSLKQQGILRERVFGCDLGEHLLNAQRDVPLVLVECSRIIELAGAVDGIYRLSGGSGLIARLRARFDAGEAAGLDEADAQLTADPHALASLLKCYFRELPNPLCTYQLYDSFVSCVQTVPEKERLVRMKEVVMKLPPPHYRTLSYLMLHLSRVSSLSNATGMTSRNLAIVWAPNLLRAPEPRHALRGVAIQAVVTEFLICYAQELFSSEQPPQETRIAVSVHNESLMELAENKNVRCHSSEPTTTSLEEARRRVSMRALSDIAANSLRPDTSNNYIEVGSGPNNLPQYHTVLELPSQVSKRGLKRSGSRWRGLFWKEKPRVRPNRGVSSPITNDKDVSMPVTPEVNPLRPVKSCESLQSETDTVPPLCERISSVPLKQHTRSASCDSYFEAWQTELNDMRLRLSPQERDRNIFSEEDDTTRNPNESGGSSPSISTGSSRGNRKELTLDIQSAAELAERKRTALEEQLSDIKFIDCDSPRARPNAEKRHSDPRRPQDLPKRVCKDRESPVSSLTDFQTSIMNVKLRDRNSPRKHKNRYSGQIHNTDVIIDAMIDAPVSPASRLTWHGKDGHSTLIKIDWPQDSSTSNMTCSTLESTPVTPASPKYELLENDDENKHTIKISQKKMCDNCTDGECLQCELKNTSFEAKTDFKIGLPVSCKSSTELLQQDSLEHTPTKESYQNLNRLSATSNSTSSKDYEHFDNRKSVMTLSHDSSTFSNTSPQNDQLYECFGANRPNYINLNTDKSTPSTPSKSPLKSTISITFRSPNKEKSPEYELMENETQNIYEDVDNLAIVEDATVPHSEPSLPTQACQPNNFDDLIILETPTENDIPDVYSQVKFLRKSIEEVNALILESDEMKDESRRHYENVPFPQIRENKHNDYENINVETLKICEEKTENVGNTKKNLNVRELANKFESPTEAKTPFTFEKFKAEVKYPSLERKDEKVETAKRLSRTSFNACSLDENAFTLEFGKKENTDLNLNKEPTTPTTENKISLIQRFEKPVLDSDFEKNLSRERIEKYKEERRNFLREKYSSQSFRSNPEHLTRIKIKKEIEIEEKETPNESESKEAKFERRNTVDLGQRMRFSLAKSASDLESIDSPIEQDVEFVKYNKCKKGTSSLKERKEQVSPSYNIRDMAAMFEQRSHKTD